MRKLLCLWAIMLTPMSFAAVDANLVYDVVNKIESVKNQEISQEQFVSIIQHIELVQVAEAQPRFVNVSGNGYIYKFLVCSFGKGNAGFLLGIGAGAEAMVCYDLKSGKVYGAIGGAISFVVNSLPAAAGGVGVMVVRHRRSESFETKYLCGNVSFSAGWLGGTAFGCGSMDRGNDSMVGFLGWQGGFVAELGGKIIALEELATE